MSGEHISEFNRKLKEKVSSHALPSDPLWEASGRFDKIYEEQLKEVEKNFLVNISPVIELIEEAANAIEEKEHFPSLRADTYIRHYEGSDYYRLKQTKKFKVGMIGYHGDKCYPVWENTGKFVQEVEKGKQISELIEGFSIEYRHTSIYFGIEASKDMQGKISSVTLKLSQSNEDISIENSDLSLFIDKLANMVADNKYIDHRTSGGMGMDAGWTSN